MHDSFRPSLQSKSPITRTFLLSTPRASPSMPELFLPLLPSNFLGASYSGCDALTLELHSAGCHDRGESTLRLLGASNPSVSRAPPKRGCEDSMPFSRKRQLIDGHAVHLFTEPISDPFPCRRIFTPLEDVDPFTERCYLMHLTAPSSAISSTRPFTRN